MNTTSNTLRWNTALKAMKEMTPPDGCNIYMWPQPRFNAYSGFEFVNRDETGGTIMVDICPLLGKVNWIGYREKGGATYIFIGEQLETHRAAFDKILEQLSLSFCGQDEPPSWNPEKYRKYWHDGKKAFEKHYWGLSTWCKMFSEKKN